MMFLGMSPEFLAGFLAVVGVGVILFWGDW